MLNFSSKKTVRSEAFPGVEFILRAMTEGRRIELRSRLLKDSTRLTEIFSEMSHLMENKAGMEQAEYGQRIAQLQSESDGLQIERLNPEWFKWGCVSIEGLLLDGKEASPEDWKELPSELFQEILEAIKTDAELSGEERKNLRSRTISGDPALLNGKTTNVPPVEPEAGTEIGTAGSITLS